MQQSEIIQENTEQKLETDKLISKQAVIGILNQIIDDLDYDFDDASIYTRTTSDSKTTLIKEVINKINAI